MVHAPARRQTNLANPTVSSARSAPASYASTAEADAATCSVADFMSHLSVTIWTFWNAAESAIHIEQGVRCVALKFCVV